MTKLTLLLSTVAVLSACSGGNGVRVLQSPGDGPDEFSVMPVRPLTLPATNALPPPTPGGTNRTDPTPRADAIAALGGTPAALVPGGVPARDSALVSAVSRNGVTADIRTVVAREDAQFRTRVGRVSAFNLTGGDPYWRVYSRQALDAYAEMERFRAAGITVPSAPPLAN